MRLLRVLRHRPRYADVASTLALVLAMSGTAYAVTALPAHSVGKKQLKKAAVSNAKVAPAAISSAKLATNAVTSSKVLNNSVTLADIAGADVTGNIAFSVSGNSCVSFSIGVAGAAVGQVVYFSFVGSTPVPSGLLFEAQKVTAPNAVTARVCNVGATLVTEPSIGIRIITFG